MLGSHILYLKGMRRMMFQLSGFYKTTTATHEGMWSFWIRRLPGVLLLASGGRHLLEGGLWCRVWGVGVLGYCGFNILFCFRVWGFVASDAGF